MRLISARVRNYRIHGDLTLEFDRKRTLIGGPNESGKSTLAEAIHHAIFLKSTVTGEAQHWMVSNIHSGHPEVEVVFEAGGKSYRVQKRFSGQSGTTILNEEGGTALNGPAAETRLASLLGVEELGGGRNILERAKNQWAHLWVWQGKGGNDPCTDVGAHQMNLVKRLQEIGGASAAQSECDACVAEMFSSAREAIFVKKGEPKAGSELARASKAVEECKAAYQIAADRVERLRWEVETLEEAAQTIETCDGSLKLLRSEKEEVDRKLAEVARLRIEEGIQSQAAKNAAHAYEELAKAHQQIDDLRQKANRLALDLEPQKTALTKLEEALRQQKAEAEKANLNLDAVQKRLQSARLSRDYAAACVGHFDKKSRLAELREQQRKVAEHDEELAVLRNQLAELPLVDEAKLEELRRYERAVTTAEATLNAIATGIEVLAADQEIRVAGAILRSGECKTFIEATMIEVGKGVRMKLTPGGGDALESARNKLKTSRDALQAGLAGIGVGSIAVASEIHLKRTDLGARIRQKEELYPEKERKKLSAALQEAEQDGASADAELARRRAQLPEAPQPADREAAQQLLGIAEHDLTAAEGDERTAREIRDGAAKALSAKQSGVQAQHEKCAGITTEIQTLEAQIKLQIENFGEDAARAARLAQALKEKSEAGAALAGTDAALKALQPEQLEGAQGRLERSIQQQQTRRQEAVTRREVAASHLKSEGADDPEEALAIAEANLEFAQQHYENVRRKAEAIRLLDELFSKEQQALAERFTQPLVDKISEYLKCLYGIDATASIVYGEDGFSGIQLTRKTHGGGAFAFTILSGGTREQVANAVRLAMAEILAPGHDGCLPVILDDAFTNSDPERVKSLQGMLDLAASRGIQVIVLTCAPSDYVALGARQIDLQSPAARALSL